MTGGHLHYFVLIDDDSDDRALFAEALAAVDPTIVCGCFESAEDALARLNKSGALPDIIFLDINLPVMSGWQCLKALKCREALSHIPVAMYSTSSYQRDKDLAIEMGAICLITKPHGYRDLENILKMIAGNIDNKEQLIIACNKICSSAQH